MEGSDYWMTPKKSLVTAKAPIAHLLPAFDEFAVAYKDRTAAVNPKYLKQAGSVIADPCIVVNNQVVGTWKRAIKKDRVEVTLNPFGELNKTQIKSVENAAEKYKKFIGG